MPFVKVTVIGGMNTDIIGTPVSELVVRDSNIGAVELRPGGVGRNIAENLARLGLGVELIAAIGTDEFSGVLRSGCEKLGIGLSSAVTVPGRGGVYLCLNDGAGDMFAAINDMELTSALTPDRLDMDAVNRSDGCVLDANIPEDTLLFAAANARVPLFADPVSCAKCRRLVPVLDRLSGIKPNLMEARLLTGVSDPLSCARALVAAGVKRAFVSLGAEGIAYADSDCAGIMNSMPVVPVNTTGAGDAATAALAAGLLMGLSTKDAARCAVKASYLALKSPGAVSADITPAILNVNNFSK